MCEFETNKVLQSADYIHVTLRNRVCIKRTINLQSDDLSVGLLGLMHV